MNALVLNKFDRLGFLSLTIIALLASINEFGGSPNIEDTFHAGEMLAGATNLYFGSFDAYDAVAIHGLSDILPALFAQWLYGPDHHFLPTIAIYRVMEVAAYLLLLTAAFQLSKNNIHRWVMLVALALTATPMVSRLDLPLLVCLNIFLLLQRNLSSYVHQILFQVLLGFVTAFGLFWSVDRGIISIVSIGIVVLLSLSINKLFYFSLLSFFLTILLLSIFSRLFSIERYIEHLNILIVLSAEWSYGIKLVPVVLTCFTTFINISSIGLSMFLVARQKYLTYENCNFILLSLLSLLMLKFVGTNRADLLHIYQSYWAPFLLLIMITVKNDSKLFQGNYKVGLLVFLSLIFFIPLITPWFGNTRYISAIVSAALMLTFLHHAYKIYVRPAVFLILMLFAIPFGYLLLATALKLYDNDYAWLKNLKKPVENVLFAPNGILWVTAKLSDLGASCIFDLSNTGVINPYAKLSVCTKFIYPIYSSPKYEPIMIEQLQAKSPSVVIYSANNMGYNMDGRNMAERFPKLDKYIQSIYINEECKFGYCLRFK